MRVTGIEKLEFGVDNLSHCAKFMCDFGLTRDASGQKFTTLSGARLELNPIDSPDLPPAFEAGNTLRRMTWGWRRCGRSWRSSLAFAKRTTCWSAAIPTA